MSDSHAKAPESCSEPPLRCPECDYDLTGAPGDRCPWCGWEIDEAQLIRASRERSQAAGWGLAAAAAGVGGGSLVALAALVVPARGLTVPDAATVVGVLAAAIGLLWLAGAIFAGRGRWPMRHREASTILGAVGWLSVLTGLAGAAQALFVSSGARGVEGIVISGVLEFVLRATLFTLPGWSLLALRAIGFRGAKASLRPARNVRASPADARADGATFSVRMFGRYEPRQVTWRRVALTRSTTPAIRAAISRTWEAERAAAESAGRSLYNGDLLRMDSARADGSTLELVLSPTSYRDFLGTNLLNARLVEKENAGGFADALGISAVVTTGDGRFALGHRSDRVAYHRGHLHLFGGMLEQQDLGGLARGNGVTLWNSLTRELREEVAHAPADAVEAHLIAIVCDRAIHQPEAIFDVRLSLSREDLKRRFRDAADREHVDIEFASDDPESLRSFLQATPRVTPVAQAGLLLHGRGLWGEAWYEAACFELFGELPALHS